MSIINELLENLEKRRSPDQFNEAVLLTGVKTTPRRRHFPLRTIFLFVLLCFSFVCAVLFFVHRHRNITLRHISLPLPLIRIYAPAVAELPRHDVDIFDSTMHTADHRATLTFSADAPFLYQLQTENKNQTLILTVENAHLSKVPEIDGAFIEKMSQTNQGDTAQIVLQLQPDTVIQQIHHQPLNTPTQLTLSFYNPNAEDKTVDMSVRVSDTQPRINARQRYEHALTLLTNHDTTQAIEELSQLLHDFPNHLLARERLALLLIEQNDLIGAESLIQRGLQLFPAHPAFLKIAARFAIDRQDNAGALQLLSRASPHIHDDPEYYALMAALYQQVGQSVMAAKLYAELLQTDGDNGVWWLGLAVNLEQTNHPQEAIAAYQEATQSVSLQPQLRAYAAGRLQQLKG